MAADDVTLLGKLKSKLIGAKQKWAEDGRLLTGKTATQGERLPPGQRQAVELLRLKEMSLKEASAASGQSVGALKVAMHRAGKSLREILTRRTGD